MKIVTLWYKIRCWAFHRYTTVKPRFLPHTFYDRSDLMPHLMFECLAQYVEKELFPRFGTTDLDTIVNYWRSELAESRMRLKKLKDTGSDITSATLELFYAKKSLSERCQIIELYRWYLTRLSELDEDSEEVQQKCRELLGIRGSLWT